LDLRKFIKFKEMFLFM